MGTSMNGVFQCRTSKGWEDVSCDCDFGHYPTLFAWLRGIGCRKGFACEPRRFPEEFQIDEDNFHGRTWMGEDSHSWLSAAEIVTIKIPNVEFTGVVSKADFAVWDGISEPTKFFFGDTSRQGIVVDRPSGIGERTTHVQVDWSGETDGAIRDFVGEMLRLQSSHGEVRFVYGFDS